jgi:hypothetical protein
MITRITWILDFVHPPPPGIIMTINRRIYETYLFPCPGEGMETPTLLGPLERANHNHFFAISKGSKRVPSSRLMKTETHSVSETLFYSIYKSG